jgi:uncharacterized membrane protein
LAALPKKESKLSILVILFYFVVDLQNGHVNTVVMSNQIWKLLCGISLQRYILPIILNDNQLLVSGHILVAHCTSSKPFPPSSFILFSLWM